MHGFGGVKSAFFFLGFIQIPGQKQQHTARQQEDTYQQGDEIKKRAASQRNRGAVVFRLKGFGQIFHNFRSAFFRAMHTSCIGMMRSMLSMFV
jgi:hypothetical protein